MRKLALKKETITELGGDDLAAVVGGEQTRTTCVSALVVWCATFYECPTHDACFTTDGCG